MSDLSELRARLDKATADLDPPFAVVDLEAFRANVADIVRRAAGKPVRVASKSVRCRALLDEVLATRGYRGVLAYSLAEGVWLAGLGIDDVVVGYPSVDRAAMRALVANEQIANRVTLMVDDVAQLDLFDAAVGHQRPDVRVCLDVDASWRPFGNVHIGVRRSPIRTPAQAAELAADVVRRKGFRLVGLMAYEAQIAGLPDSSAVIRYVKKRSVEELARRRAAVVQAVQAVSPLEFVNGGGTGSVESTASEAAVTEVAAGSGLYGPTLFDGYRSFHPRPAALFALSVVRKPVPGIATLFSGGYVASGQAKKNRLPTPSLPDGLSLIGTEGAGEVQTPVRGAAAAQLRVGDRVWMRHAKAGEMCERFDALHLVEGSDVVRSVPTYRGEGKNFG